MPSKHTPPISRLRFATGPPSTYAEREPKMTEKEKRTVVRTDGNISGC
jgi:hypothetical protein